MNIAAKFPGATKLVSLPSPLQDPKAAPASSTPDAGPAAAPLPTGLKTPAPAAAAPLKQVRIHYADGRLRAGSLVSQDATSVTVRFQDNGKEEQVVLGDPHPRLLED